MPRKLINLRITEVSGVDKAANKRRFLIAKRVDPELNSEVGDGLSGEKAGILAKIGEVIKGVFGSGEAKDLNTILTSRAIDEEMWNLTSSLRDTVADKKTAVATVLQQFFAALIGTGIMKGEDLSKAGRKISASRMEMLKQMQAQLQQLIAEAEVVPDQPTNKNQGGNVPVEKITMDMLPEEVRKSLEAIPQLSQDLKKQQDENADLKKRLDEQKTENEDLKKRLQDSEDVQKKQVYIAKAAGYKNLATTPEELGDLFKAVAENKATPEQIQKLEGIMKSADEAIAKGALFKEFGRGGGGSGAAGSAAQKLDQMARERVTKNAGETYEQAYDAVIKENKELYNQYLEEEGGK